MGPIKFAVALKDWDARRRAWTTSSALKALDVLGQRGTPSFESISWPDRTRTRTCAPALYSCMSTMEPGSSFASTAAMGTSLALFGFGSAEPEIRRRAGKWSTTTQQARACQAF